MTNENRNNTNDRTEKKFNPNEFRAKLFLDDDIDDTIKNDIIDTITNNRFNKISVPVSTYRSVIDPDADSDDTRTTTIGYIRRYNPKTKTFTIIIFDKFISAMASIDEMVIEPLFTIYKNRFGTITKFIVGEMPNVCDDSE